jgi:hypothetical protein
MSLARVPGEAALHGTGWAAVWEAVWVDLVVWEDWVRDLAALASAALDLAALV